MKRLGQIAAILIAAGSIANATPAIAGEGHGPGAMHEGKHGHRNWSSLFAGMSPEGMAIMGKAMKRDRSNTADIMKARRHVLELISAERIDIDAIRRAQAVERKLVMEKHARAQEKMLRAYQQLSLEDRRVFAEGMRLREERMLRYMQNARERMEKQREQFQKQYELIRERPRGDESGFLIIIPQGPFAPIFLVPRGAPARDYG